jgi:hypothetical protein
MRNRRILYVCVVVALCGTALAAPDCINARGELQRQLWDGYTLLIGPATGDHINECRAAVVASDGKAVFEIFGVDAGMNGATGRDVSNDGSRDVVIESHTASPGNVYSIVGTRNPAGLLRQLTTTVRLSFEDRKGDGHIEIVTHDTAFLGFEGLENEESPQPPVFLRLKGKEIFNVSTLYWPEYEMEITRAKAQLGRDDVGDFMGTTPSKKTEKDKAAGPTPQEERRNLATKATVLKIVLNYLYAGKGQEAWQALKDMWPYADRDRVRQAILKTRMSGVLGDINRSTAKPAASP